MKVIILFIFIMSLSSTLSAQKDCYITSEKARQIAEKFVSCSGYTTEKLPPDVCGEFTTNCNEKIIPCEFIEKRAFGYFPPRQNEEKGWTIVFRTRGELKSKITGVKVTMDEVGKNVNIEESKVFLKFVDKRY